MSTHLTPHHQVAHLPQCLVSCRHPNPTDFDLFVNSCVDYLSIFPFRRSQVFFAVLGEGGPELALVSGLACPDPSRPNFWPCKIFDRGRMLKKNDEWAVSRRYMTLETLSTVSHNPIVSLPVMAA